MSKEALKLALEALEKQVSMAGGWQSPAEAKAITAIKQTLKEHAMRETQRLGQEIEQEPVAWWNDTGTHIDLNVSGRGAPLYTTPPQRTWVGLTEQDLDYLCNLAYTGDEEFALAVQAKLMEKNA